jgi:hypothetical protein
LARPGFSQEVDLQSHRKILIMDLNGASVQDPFHVAGMVDMTLEVEIP